MTQTRTRKQDPDKFEMTPEEFANIVRNGGNGKPRFDWQGWIKVLFIILLPGIALITYVNNVDSNVDRNRETVERHEVWIGEHIKDTASLRDSIRDVEAKQGIILEKITRAQQDIEQLLRESRSQ